jgi:quinol monooxygenase YgiN
MRHESIRVIAKVTARPETVEEVKALLQDLVPPTRAEKGCVSYEVCQSNSAPAEFVCIEAWASASDIEAHMRTPHVQAAFAKAQSLLAAPPQISDYSAVA